MTFRRNCFYNENQRTFVIHIVNNSIYYYLESIYFNNILIYKLLLLFLIIHLDHSKWRTSRNFFNEDKTGIIEEIQYKILYITLVNIYPKTNWNGFSSITIMNLSQSSSQKVCNFQTIVSDLLLHSNRNY